ncbi:serine/threonine-protein kinase [Virgisporangium aurantiacum]|nr:serine/threonine-protein kinase [Virgisporangium aurantiacum]
MCGIDVVVSDRFELRAVIGRGGMGCVWLAYDRALRREVALKETAAAGDLSGLRDRVLREARAAARINHPNVVRVLDVVDASRRPWIVMEHVPSWSLRELLTRNGPLPPGYVAAVGIAVLDALTATHRAGVLHRDVTPGNVLIGHDGRVVLADFGIALRDGQPADDAPALGTPQYVPPERASANLSLPEGDLYSLGATLYTAVEGRGPFDRDSVEDTLAALRDSAPDPPRCADDLAAVLAGLLRRDPYLRWRPARARRELVRVAREARPDAERHGAVRGVLARPVQPSTIAMPVPAW